MLSGSATVEATSVTQIIIFTVHMGSAGVGLAIGFGIAGLIIACMGVYLLWASRPTRRKCINNYLLPVEQPSLTSVIHVWDVAMITVLYRSKSCAFADCTPESDIEEAMGRAGGDHELSGTSRTLSKASAE